MRAGCSCRPPDPPCLPSLQHGPTGRLADALLAFFGARSGGEATVHPAAAVASCRRIAEPHWGCLAGVSIAAACPAADPLALGLASQRLVELGLRHDSCFPRR